MLELVRLPGYGDRLPRQLSGGQQQRVALARALVFHPRVLLMDEPFGALDRALRETLRAELRELHRTLGITVVLVTHDQDEAHGPLRPGRGHAGRPRPAGRDAACRSTSARPARSWRASSGSRTSSTPWCSPSTARLPSSGPREAGASGPPDSPVAGGGPRRRAAPPRCGGDRRGRPLERRRARGRRRGRVGARPERARPRSPRRRRAGDRDPAAPRGRPRAPAGRADRALVAAPRRSACCRRSA